MYNYHPNYQTYQSHFIPQYLSWPSQYFFIPLTETPLIMEFNNTFHYQTEKHQISASTGQNQEFESPYGQKHQLCQQNRSDESFEGNDQTLIKKRKYYGTKNTEANIINQTFSFMHCPLKSQKVLDKLVKGNQQKIETFYTMMKIVKKNLKKYVNRTYLKSLFSTARSNPVHKLLSKGKKRLQILSVREFTELFRKMVWYYFNSEMVAHLLNSSRLSKNTIGEHLKRRREIMDDIFQSVQCNHEK